MYASSICVVGGGLAGGIVAAELARAGRRVTLLEQGAGVAPLVPDDEDWPLDGALPQFTRGQGLGGTTNFWHGGLICLDATDLDRPEDNGRSARLPIGFDELVSYYRRALRTITGEALQVEDLLPTTETKQCLQPSSPIFQKKPSYLMSRPFSTRTIIEQAVARHGLRHESFQAESIIFEGDGRASAVQGYRRGEKALSKIAADIIVVCAGGLGSPKLLLKSARMNTGLASLPVGNHITDHPSGIAFKAQLRHATSLDGLFGCRVPGCSRLRRRVGFKLQHDHLDMAGGRNHALYLRPAFSLRDPHTYTELKNKLIRGREGGASLLEKAQIVKYPDLLMESASFHYGINFPVRYVSGFVVAEQHPRAEHRLELKPNGRFAVRWAISDDDRASIARFTRAFLDSYDGTFCRHVHFSGLLGAGAHHSGGCRMARDPADGVVDQDMRVFGTRNLFVVDGSVLGYTGHANTGLTIAALAHRCSDIVRRESARFQMA